MRFSTPFTLLLALLPTVTTAQALSEEDGSEEYVGLDAADALMMDAEIIAANNGWSVRDTVAYLDAQAEFSELAATIAERYPDDFSSSVNLMSPTDLPEIYFKGKVPSEAQALLDSAVIVVEVHEDTGMNAVEWEERAEVLATLLRAEGLDSFAVAFDGVDSIEVVLGNGASVPATLPAEYLTSDILFESVPDAILVTQGVHGGGDALLGTSHICTFGWCVENSSGVRGVLTAGHCDSVNAYENPDTSTKYAAAMQASHEGWWGDFAWHTTTGNEWPNWFADEYLNKRRMDGIKTSWSQGDATCVFGMTSFERMCTTIYRTSVYSGGHNMMVVTVDGDTLGGDSGGGWSLSTTAHGVHTGLIPLGGSDRSIFSRASRVDNALGVDICESP